MTALVLSSGFLAFARQTGFLAAVEEVAPSGSAVAASCAVPRLFAPVRVGRVPYRDGGMADRTFLHAAADVDGCQLRALSPAPVIGCHCLLSLSGGGLR